MWKLFRKLPKCRYCGNAISKTEKQIREEEGKVSPRWYCDYCSVILPGGTDMYKVNRVNRI